MKIAAAIGALLGFVSAQTPVNPHNQTHCSVNTMVRGNCHDVYTSLDS